MAEPIFDLALESLREKGKADAQALADLSAAGKADGTKRYKAFCTRECICQAKVDTQKTTTSQSPVRSCTELGFYSPKPQQDDSC